MRRNQRRAAELENRQIRRVHRVFKLSRMSLHAAFRRPDDRRKRRRRSRFKRTGNRSRKRRRSRFTQRPLRLVRSGRQRRPQTQKRRKERQIRGKTYLPASRHESRGRYAGTGFGIAGSAAHFRRSPGNRTGNSGRRRTVRPVFENRIDIQIFNGGGQRFNG